ncbi:MAG: type III pantothenate kinase [Bacteroidia bacterium]
MSIYTLDIGNTRSKWVLFSKEGKIQDSGITSDVNNWIQKHLDFEVWVSCVGKLPEFGPYHRLLTLENLDGIHIGIENPQTLGVDRIAGILGALSRFNKANMLIIDAGSCITYDYLINQQNYAGGAISPGLNLRFKSMNDYTFALPLIDSKSLSSEISHIEKNTKTAIQSGVFCGVIDEIDTRIRRFCDKFNDAIVILTGGDAELLGNQLKTNIFVEPYLIHYGLFHAAQNKD